MSEQTDELRKLARAMLDEHYRSREELAGAFMRAADKIEELQKALDSSGDANNTKPFVAVPVYRGK